MSGTTISLLLIDSDSRLSTLLDADAAARGYRLTSVASLDEALSAAAREPFHAALIDLEPGPQPGLDGLRRLKVLSPNLEIIVLSSSRSLAAAIRSYELAAFAFVPKPVESAQLVATIDRIRRHQSVRRGKSEWERTFDAIGDPIAVFNRSGQLLRGNVALAAFLGRPVTELPHTSCCEVGFCGGGCPACAVGQALRRDTSAAEITLPNGRIFTVTTFPVGGADDASVVQVAKDVTEQIQSARKLQRVSDELASTNAQLMATVQQLKSTQAQLLQAEKLSAIGQLVAGVAHELNNPLTSVIGYAQLLEQELLDTDEDARIPGQVRKDLRRIAEESERAARIVRNLLAFARRQTTARVPQDVADLVSRVLSLRSYDLRLNDVELVTEFESGLPQVVADGGQLQQALLNLILNGEQAMRNMPARRLTVGARLDRQAGAVEVFVSDTGHGIDPANLSRIFDPFFTTREVGEGTGLGLSICYGILRDHGGEIAVESRVQEGTTFSVRLPARTFDSVAGAGDILVAHPDQGERDFLAAALAGWGYTVVPVSRPEEALERYVCGHLTLALVERSLLRASAEGWAMLVRCPGAPVVLLAPAGNDDEIEGFVRKRVHGVLATPFQLRSLRAAVRAIAKEEEYA
jgi:signal transduction histidine kinase